MTAQLYTRFAWRFHSFTVITTGAELGSCVTGGGGAKGGQDFPLRRNSRPGGGVQIENFADYFMGATQSHLFGGTKPSIFSFLDQLFLI